MLITLAEYNEFTEIEALADKLAKEIVIFRFLAIRKIKELSIAVLDFIKDEDKTQFYETMQIAEKYLNQTITEKECDKLKNTIKSMGIYAASNVVHALGFMIINAYNGFDHYSSYLSDAIKSACQLIRKWNYTKPIEVFHLIFPWDNICALQITQLIFNSVEDQIELLKKVKYTEKLIDYATVIIGEPNLREEFVFLIKDFIKKEN